MNPLQEMILDRLVGAKTIGTRWSPGPLRLAARALAEDGLAVNLESHKSLGFPLPFCAAIEGASECLKNVEEVRTLAIALFSEIMPRDELLELSEHNHVEIAAWCARYWYFHFDRPSDLCDEISAVLDDYLSGRGSSWISSIHRFDRRFDRVFFRNTGNRPYSQEKLLHSVFFFALHTARRAARRESTEENASRTCRDAGRLAAVSAGLDGAVPFCLELARMMRL